VQHEPLPVDRVLEPVHPVLAQRDPFAPLLPAAVSTRAVLPRLFGVVHRDVGLDDQILRGEVILSGEHRDADRSSHLGVTLTP